MYYVFCGLCESQHLALWRAYCIFWGNIARNTKIDGMHVVYNALYLLAISYLRRA